MKKEIDKFWSMIQSDNYFIQKIGFKKWDYFEKKYPDYSINLRRKLLKDFYSIYKKVNFHDFHIIDINCDFNVFQQSEIKLHLYDFHEDYDRNLRLWLIYRGVSNYSLNISSSKFAMTWGNDIFYTKSKEEYVHKIIFSDSSNINIAFKEVNVLIEKG